MKTTYPFNSTNGDRKYNADDIAAERAVYFSDGIIVYGGNVIGTELQVEAVTGMTVKVKYGMANIKGRTIKIEAPDEGETEVVLSTADLTNPRIDRIVLEMNLTDPVRDIVIKAIAGTPAASPVAPALTRTAEIWQLSLAQIAVTANSSTIGEITDDRSDNAVCGISNVSVGITPPTGNDAVTVKLSNETAELYGLENVDEVLLDLGHSKSKNLESYIALASNVNTTAKDVAFLLGDVDSCNEYNFGLGYQIAKYIDDFSNDYAMTNEQRQTMASKSNWYQICNDSACRTIIAGSVSFLALVNSVLPAKYVYDNYSKFKTYEEIISDVNTALGTSFKSLTDIKANATAMTYVMGNYTLCSQISNSLMAQYELFGYSGEYLDILGGATMSGNFTVPLGVTKLFYILVSGGAAGSAKQGKIIQGVMNVTPGQLIGYVVGNGATSGESGGETSLGTVNTIAATKISESVAGFFGGVSGSGGAAASAGAYIGGGGGGGACSDGAAGANTGGNGGPGGGGGGGGAGITSVSGGVGGTGVGIGTGGTGGAGNYGGGAGGESITVAKISSILKKTMIMSLNSRSPFVAKFISKSIFGGAAGASGNTSSNSIPGSGGGAGFGAAAGVTGAGLAGGTGGLGIGGGGGGGGCKYTSSSAGVGGAGASGVTAGKGSKGVIVIFW